MLVVSILPLRGNTNTPEFPFDGAFGLTDVCVRGKVVTKLDKQHPNPKPVEAVEAIVRLVRVDALNRSTFREIVCEKTLWKPPTGQTSSKLGEWEGEFELVVPASTPGLSRMGIMVGKVPGHCATISWKLEAVVSFPKERPTSASPRELSFLRHSLPSSSSPSIPSLSWSSTSSTIIPPFPSLDYDVHVANRPLGWNDSSELSYRFRVPQSTTFYLKSIELVLCREVTILNSASTSTFVDELPLDLFREDGVPATTRPPHKSRSPLVPRHSSPEPPASPVITPAVIPTDEHGRPLPVVPRSPSPPEKAINPRTSWPLVLAEGEAGYFETRGVLRFRARPPSNHRWSLGETGENRFLRCSFAIRPKILYKRSTGPFASDKILDLQPLPMQVAAVTATTPFKAARHPHLASRMGERRISDFSLTINLVATGSPAPPLPSPSAHEIRRLSAATEAQRPLAGRRRSEQSEVFGQPARTRARTEEPWPLRRPSTATGVLPSSLAPEVAQMPSSISPSSTYDSLGPDTPNTVEFLLTPVPAQPFPTPIMFHCPLSLEHNPPHEVLSGRLQPYFESPERYVRILDGLLSPEDGEGAVFDEIKLDWKPEEVEMEELRYAIEAVHDGDYLTFLREIYDEWVAEGGSKDAVLPETFVRSDMLLEPTRLPRNVNQSAIARTGRFSCDLSAPITSGSPPFASLLSRPPGHHAGPALCGGYCYLNSLAIALRYYQAHRSTASVPKVAILDIDYHHGNGTSKVFYDDPSVLYVSLHGSPDYPYYTGASSERGGPSAPGTNLNYPLPLGTDNATYLRTLTMAGQAIKSFDAEVLFVSLGVDTFIDDPLTDFHITLEAYPQIGALIASLGLRTLFVLEGGYCLPAIGACVRGVLEGFVASRAAAM
ncbi:hypothetical protein JCM1841_002621 [Sporobolomyces salmonicolor]